MAVELIVGDRAPDFSMSTDEGEIVSLSGLSGKIVVLYFYPKDDTSGCTSQALSFSADAEAFAKAGAIVIGVSRDTLESHAKFRKKHDLTIKLASDAAGAVTEAFGVWVEKSMYGRKYFGIERSTFIIDRDSKIRSIWRKVKVPGHVESVLKTVKSMNA
jgi:thioredoxin-dependent peroxiredoxin